MDPPLLSHPRGVRTPIAPDVREGFEDEVRGVEPCLDVAEIALVVEQQTLPGPQVSADGSQGSIGITDLVVHNDPAGADIGVERLS
ncbi:hypothetical protein ACFV5N_00180 [Streptomyces sp. NPDC059853]|uniref:hypothetical protein n=1 Tax=Streptomyces sp. NPDC059853 TaxID=3346973 RepID=UPI00364809D7